jgi:pyrroline-5-carboxylate reductase
MTASGSFDLVLIGGGNMGSALLGGLLAAGQVAAGDVAVVELDADRRQALSERFDGVTVLDSVPSCAAAVLAVKPAGIADTARVAAEAGAKRVLSIAAGVTTATIRSVVGDGVDVVRSMPNTPAMVGEGITAICIDDESDPAALDWAEGVLSAVGMVVRVGEEHFDAVTGLTGSGPAYVFAVAESLIEAGLAAGLPADLVEPMVTQLLVGASALLAERGDPAALRVAVTSPGGTTAAGLAVLDEKDLTGAFVAAVRAATERGRELGRA